MTCSSANTISVATTDTTSEPMHPSPLEKKMNIRRATRAADEPRAPCQARDQSISAVHGNALGGGDRVAGEASDARLSGHRCRCAGPGYRRPTVSAERSQIARDGGHALRDRREDDDQVWFDLGG